ncbi:MAG: glycosyltransferase family 39 protein [Acutalibacter sp.]
MLFLLSLVIHLGVVAVITTPIESDFGLQYEASQQFARGDFSFQDTVYFQRWGYQTGLVIWQGVLLKLWNNPLFLRLVNCVVSAGTNVLVYWIARDYFEERAAKLASLAYAFFLFPATLVTVLCNNIPSAFFLYLCLYLVMGKRFERRPRLLIYALAGVSLSIANALRPDAPLVLVPLLAYFVFRFLSQASLRNFLQYLSKFAALFLTFLVLSTALSGLVQITGVNSAGLKNHDPLWGVVLGTNPETGGTYNDEDAQAINALTQQGMTRSQAELEVISQHLHAGPAKLLETGVRKLRTLWWDSALGWSLGNLMRETPVLFAFLEELDRAMFTCALFLAGLGALALFRRPREDFKLYLVPFVIFATSCVYLILEVQPRYCYAGQIAVFILMAGGVQVLTSLWETVTKEWRKLARSRERFREERKTE